MRDRSRDEPEPFQTALMDQTNRLLDDVLDAVEKHWTVCGWTDDQCCIGEEATHMIGKWLFGPSATQNHLEALLLMSISRAARLRFQIEGGKDDKP